MRDISIIVGGRFHAFAVARELERRDRLAAIVSTYPLAYRERIQRKQLVWNPILGLRERLESSVWPIHEASRLAAERFGRWAARKMPPADIVQGWTGYSLETFLALSGTGTTRIARRGSAHIRAQAALIQREYTDFGIRLPSVLPAMVEREMMEYEEADFIHVSSSFARDTFIAEGHAPERLIVTPLGADKSRGEELNRRMSEGRRPGPLRVLYLGHVSFRKGLQYLLPAVARLGSAARLSIIGGVAPDGEDLLRRFATGRELRGHVSRAGLPALFAAHDVLVLPSVEDGFGAVICEAMAAGLPVVATTHTGGPDVIDDGVSGLLVEPRDVDALTMALESLAASPERARAMGVAAFRAIDARLTWKHIVDGMVALYDSARAGAPAHALRCGGNVG